MFMVSRKQKKNPYLTPFGKFCLTLGVCVIVIMSLVYAVFLIDDILIASMLWDINITTNVIVVGVKLWDHFIMIWYFFLYV